LDLVQELGQVMGEVRYGIAVALVCPVPGTFAYWLSIHPFVRFWRRVGPRRTVALHLFVAVLIALMVASQRRWVLAVEFGNHPWLFAAAVSVLMLAAMVRKQVGAQLRLSTMMGFPELDPAGHPQPLVTAGPYARVRHPRYLQMSLVLWGWALLANYLAPYVLAVLALPWIRLLVHWEESELCARYGAEYEEYALRVPRFIPRFR
jgi:protein-S-isoprenylcysteine O-methyltransferase Ste14